MIQTLKMWIPIQLSFTSCNFLNWFPFFCGFVYLKKNILQYTRFLMLYIHLHLQAVKKFMKLACKCHGVSGACTIRTCWQAMQPFRRVGEYLKRKYNGATHVMIDQGGSGIVVANHHFKKPTRKDLVYMEASPDYCVRDLSIGESACLRTFF